MKPLVYVETSIVSYLTARPSRDLVTAARQTWTREWWDIAPSQWRLRISDLVLEEAARGDPSAALLRLDALQNLEVVEINTEARSLAARLIEAGAMPQTEAEDALHIAIASVAGAHYLVTWNFAHLVGPDAKLRLLDTLRACECHAPLLTTPEELLEIIK
ncbi:MAG: type II toxin-antitoxin system VapC family toxin [Propionivibrio sp.]|uniref:Type II toxin-antitoxin system VapC family toxin n=1 Tax=Candidatus Propionivibrio dominans TaxID=2954373 RepID=A0A9D7F568_9RHOO|nr:type II toxin-antitoxin system VapC family toxin [Candidatus Propionivibrio dominans]MBL0168502.1 type II toxin-antitoxin system VapC family toxin [Propionivibrio sp.]